MESLGWQGKFTFSTQNRRSLIASNEVETDSTVGNGGEEVTPYFQVRSTKTESLAKFVDAIWYWRGYELPESRERILPWGTVELVINLSDSAAEYSVISGPHSKAFVVDRVLNDELVGVHFKPGGAFPFLNAPFEDFLNRHFCVADVWGHSVSDDLISRVREADSVPEKLDRVEKWLTEITEKPMQHDVAVRDALRAFSAAPSYWSSEAFARASNMSQRRFIRRFREEVGLTPKLFCRIRRFHDIVQAIGRQDHVDWSGLAVANGYFDQAHFNHEFREFCGLTPSEYLVRRVPHHLGHIQDRAD